MGSLPAFGNTTQRYGTVAMLLHWGMAVLLVVLAAMAVAMVRLPDAGYDREKILVILVHKALGIAALGLAVVRLAWRAASPLPRLADTLPGSQQVAARFVHLVFYALMLALPLTGWLMSSAGGYPVPLWDGFDLPDLIRPDEYLFRLFIDVHRWLGYALLALLALHAGAALHHHDTLRRMLPGA